MIRPSSFIFLRKKVLQLWLVLVYATLYPPLPMWVRPKTEPRKIFNFIARLLWLLRRQQLRLRLDYFRGMNAKKEQKRNCASYWEIRVSEDDWKGGVSLCNYPIHTTLPYFFLLGTRSKILSFVWFIYYCFSFSKEKGRHYELCPYNKNLHRRFVY